VLDRVALGVTTLATEEVTSGTATISLYVAWILCILSLIGIVIAARRWM
jgi:hypothetical protein